jgi:hypothetical protein
MGLVADSSGAGAAEPTPPEALRWEFFLQQGVRFRGGRLRKRSLFSYRFGALLSSIRETRAWPTATSPRDILYEAVADDFESMLELDQDPLARLVTPARPGSKADREARRGRRSRR